MVLSRAAAAAIVMAMAGCAADGAPEMDARSVLALPDAGSPPAAEVPVPTPPSTPEAFSLIVMPDTQVQVYKWPDDYYAQMRWVAANVVPLNVRYVIHIGDVVEGCVYGLTAAQIEDQWKRARAGIDLIEGKVPYVLAIGNHDFDGWGIPCDPSNTDFGAGITKTNRVASNFNRYFPRSRYAAWPTFGGTFPDDLNDNSFHLFTAGGTDWMIVTLKYQPTDAELAWARGVVEAHPDRQVIVSTHSYLSGNGKRSPDGDRVWNNLGKLYPNVSFILSGHINSKRQTSVGDHRNTVYEIMSDYQTYSDRNRNTFVRVMAFDPAAKTVSVRAYSPTLARDNTDAADDDHFVLENVSFLPQKR